MKYPGLALAALCAAAFVARAEESYPNRAIRIIVPVAPGAAADTLPRVVGDKLSRRFGQPVVIENRPGASLNLGAEVVAKAEPDGYTLLAAPPPPLTIKESLFSSLRFDPSAFTPVTIIAAVPNVLVANIDAPFRTLPEFVAYARANPDRLAYASAGQGSSPHLAMEWLKSLTGARVVHAPYSGGLAPALTDVLGGHVALMFNNLPNVLQLIRDGRVRALGVDGATRSPALPDVPAIAETYPGFVVTTWFGVVAPPKTDPAIAAKLSAAIAEEIRRPDFVELLDGFSAIPVRSAPAEAADFMKRESARWREVVGKIGVKLD